MASSNTVSSTLPSRDYHCKVCDLYLDSIDSLEVHVQYHKENLYVKWGTQTNQNDADNNNASRIKSETTVSAAADSSDNMITKPSPEFQHRATPETSTQFPHPATPQSYHSAPSPYQNPDQTSFSPSTQFNNAQYSHAPFSQNQHPEQHGWEQAQYNQEYHKHPRFHPYQERVSQVSSSSPLYPQPLNQPTPSPSPNQCDKCGFVCDSAIQLTEHCNTAHNATQQGQYQHTQSFSSKQYPNFSGSSGEVKVKEEQEESSDILDLDSQKVVYQGTEAEQAGSTTFEQPSIQGRDNSRSMPSMLPWEAQKMYNNPSINGESPLFKEQKMFADQKSYAADVKMYHSEHKFPFTQEKSFVPGHHEQKPFLHPDQKMFPGLSSLGIQQDYANAASAANPDMKPPYRPYDSPGPQISSTQSTNPTSSALPTISGKGANWKSNEARRPKTYNCTACNKWFTSSGHLKRHYNTTLHKNAVRSSGQPDPATVPISNHHHPSRDQNRGPPPSDSNTHSPGSGDDGRSVEESLQSPYAPQSYERGHRTSAIQSKSPYSHLQQGNIDTNFMSNNPLANHPLPHQVGTHSLNIGSLPLGIGNPNESNHQVAKSSPNSTGNPPNGEAGPSVSQNHHMRGLLSVSASNISTPDLPQNTPQITPHTLPPFSHLGVNPYNPRSTEPLIPTVPDPTHTPLYLGQNFQQSIAPNYPNGMAPHVTDTAINNLHIASPVTFGECVPEGTEVMDIDTPNESSVYRLPSFAQIQSQKLGLVIHNYLPSPNVGGPCVSDLSPDSFLIYNSYNSDNGVQQYNYGLTNVEKNNYEFGFVKNENAQQNNTEKLGSFQFVEVKNEINQFVNVKNETNQYVNVKNETNQFVNVKNEINQFVNVKNETNQFVNVKNETNQFVNVKNETNQYVNVKDETNQFVNVKIEIPQTLSELQIIKIEDIMDYANKENYEREMKSPASPESAKIGYDSSGGSPSVSSTVPGPPLLESNKPNQIHKCFECDKVFNKACYLTQHNKSFHSGAKPFKCERCGKRFSDDVSYEEHFSKHAGIKPFKCQECPKSFNHKTDLRRHMCLHSGTKPFACEQCGKGFIRKDHMLKHCDTHKKKNNYRHAT